MITVFTEKLNSKQVMDYVEAFVHLHEYLKQQNCENVYLLNDLDSSINYLIKTAGIKRVNEKKKRARK